MKDLMKLEEIMRRAKELIKLEKEVTKLLYQLAFIYTNESPRKEEALRLMQRLAEMGLVSPKQITKAINDVKRWRKMRYRLSRDMEYETYTHYNEAEKELRDMDNTGEET